MSDESDSEEFDFERDDSTLNQDFKELVDEFFEKLRKNGIRCEKDWTCCQTCGHAAMKKTKNYVFFNAQAADRLYEGDTEVYLNFYLGKFKRKFVYSIIRMYGEWDGTDEKCIHLKLETYNKYKASEKVGLFRMIPELSKIVESYLV